MEETLDTPVNQKVESGLNHKAVKTYLKMISENHSAKSVQVAEDEAIRELLKANFDISDPQGNRKLNSQRLYQALWRTHAKMIPHQAMIHGTGRKAHHEAIVTNGVRTVMDRGGYSAALRDKNGVFIEALLVGDAFLLVGTNPDKKSYAPILFTPVNRSNVYMDNFATGIRNRGTSGSAYRACAVFSYSWNQAVEMYPELKDKGGTGRIPRYDNQKKDDKRTDEQETAIEEEVEICFAFDIIKKNFTVFAGQACTVLEEFNGDEYPFIKDGDPYIPILQYICVPSMEGAYNYGLGHLLYKLAIVSSRLLNLQLGHAEDSVYPITLVNTPVGEADKFFRKLGVADKMRAAGKKPFVAIEHDPNSPQGGIQAQSLLTQSLANEWMMTYNALIDEIQMLGINVKELIAGGSPTATELLLDEKNADKWLEGVSEVNASVAQDAIEITMDCIKKFVGKTSRTPLNLTETITYEGTEIRPDNVTLGMVATELKEHNYFVVVDSKSAKVPSDSMARAQALSILPYLAPGSPAFNQAVKMLTGLADMDFSGEEAQAPQLPQAPQGAPGVPGVPGAPEQETSLLA